MSQTSTLPLANPADPSWALDQVERLESQARHDGLSAEAAGRALELAATFDEQGDFELHEPLADLWHEYAWRCREAVHLARLHDADTAELPRNPAAK